MSLSHDFIVSEFRHYDYKSTFINSKKPVDVSISSPPSYSAVLAEKYQQQCATWDKKLTEMDHLLQSMKRSIKDTQFMLKSYQRCCQRLELKNQTLLLSLKSELSLLSDIDTTSFDFVSAQSDQSYQEYTNDSLNRMNQALQRLIMEAEISLNSRLASLDAPVVDHSLQSLRKTKSCPRLDKQLQQKKRYLYSQWKLATTMRQFIETVQSTTREKKLEPNITESAVIHHHYHHIHHHHYHHHQHHHDYTQAIDTTLPSSPSNSQQAPSTPSLLSTSSPTVTGSPKMLRSASSLTSLFKYAIDTVGGFIPQSPPSSIITDMLQAKPIITTTKSATASSVSKSTLHRAMFISTILMMRKFNYSSLWIRRGKQAETYWKSRPRHSNLLRNKAHLLWYILQLFVSKSAISSSTRRPFVL